MTTIHSHIELQLPIQDKTTGKWFVQAEYNYGLIQCLRVDYAVLEAPTNDTGSEIFLFDTEYDAHRVAARWYISTGRKYPYRVEWESCAPADGNLFWVQEDESQVMEFE